MRKFIQGRRPLVAYLIIVTFMLGGFWRLESTVRQQDHDSKRLEYESKARIYNQCVRANEARAATVQGFKDYTQVLISLSSTRQRTPEEQAQFDAVVEQFKRQTEERLLKGGLAPEKCPPEPVLPK